MSDSMERDDGLGVDETGLADEPAQNDVFAQARAERKQRLVAALLDFDWGNYRLDSVEEAVEYGQSDPSSNQWAEELAEKLMAVLLVPSKIRP